MWTTALGKAWKDRFRGTCLCGWKGEEGIGFSYVLLGAE